MRDKNEQIDQWREAHRNSEASRRIAEEQIDKLLDQGRTTNFLLASMTPPPRSLPPGGGDS